MNVTPQISKPTNSAEPIESSSKLFTALALGAIVLVNLFTFRHCFGGYFLADDFVHIDYLYHAIDQNFMPLLANFWGNWMQAQGTTFYRPLISISLAFDYLVGGPNPQIFHISNWLYQTLASCLMFLLAGQLGERFRPGEKALNRSLALACALFFSVYPLHCEVVNWVIARVDSIALVFCLLSFWLYLKSAHDKKNVIYKLSLFAFVLGLMSKEMAVTLPPTLLLLYLLSSAKGGLIAGLKETKDFWIVLIVYLLFRICVLGTISGGYEGSVGQGLSNSLGKRWLDGSLWRILFPFNIDVFGSKHSLSVQLKAVYVAMLVSFGAALFKPQSRSAALRGLIFAVGWLVLSLLPTYQVWNLTAALQGSRFIYYGTAPIALIFAWLLFPVEARNWPVLSSLRLAASVWFTIILIIITSGNNQPWNHAMREVSLFRKAVVEQALKNKEQHLCLLNIPHTYRGAHMLYNAATMSVLLSKPLTSEPIYPHIISFEPATFGEPDLINISRLRDQAASALFRWDRNTMTLEPVLFTGEKSDLKMPARGISDQTIFISNEMSLDARSPDFIEVLLPLDQVKQNPEAVITLTALAPNNLQCHFSKPLREATNQGHLRFDVSEHKQWLALGQVNQITLAIQGLKPEQTLPIVAIESGTLLNQRPIVASDGKTLIEDGDGICRPKGKMPSFNYDATMVPGAVSVYVEVSKPNSWFEHYSGSFRATSKSPEAQHSHTLGKLKGNGVPITFTGVKGPGFFQMRLAALDQEGKIIGYFSDPLNFQL
ncbi:MAG: glycosyltransferase family 39 protein [Candidatus Obscuribacterales bacterium]|jgi:hypothetical protein